MEPATAKILLVLRTKRVAPVLSKKLHCYACLAEGICSPSDRKMLRVKMFKHCRGYASKYHRRASIKLTDAFLKMDTLQGTITYPFPTHF